MEARVIFSVVYGPPKYGTVRSKHGTHSTSWGFQKLLWVAEIDGTVQLTGHNR